MARPFVLVQLSDPHLGATWGPADPIVGLVAAIDAILALETPADALLVSGDLADGGLDAEYEQLFELVGRIGVPVHVLPGNHDDREALRRRLRLTDDGGRPLNQAIELGPLRLLSLDTTVPGEAGGELDDEQLAWLDRELAGVPDTPAVIAMHHPPFATGMPAFDRIGLAAHARHAIDEVIARHPQVRALVAGHVHRTCIALVGGRPALCAPSTYVEARLSLLSPQLEFIAGRPGFVVHAILDGELVSHIEFVERRR